MAQWSLDDIAWDAFDASKVNPELVPLIKAASLVEHNGHDYARYLCEVFAEDKEVQNVMRSWAEEEVQHGRALRRWAELADPKFNFDECFQAFTTGYQLPQNVSQSVRGSHAGELLARCVVETGTSSYYTAIREHTGEPVLKALCAKIAADEFRHYKLFYSLMKQYMEKEGLGLWKRLGIALQRIVESEDDELSYAFYAASARQEGKSYIRRRYAALYFFRAFGVYQKYHIDRMVAMVLKAVGVKPYNRLNQAVTSIAWNFIRFKRTLTRILHRDSLATLQPA